MSAVSLREAKQEGDVVKRRPGHCDGDGTAVKVTVPVNAWENATCPSERISFAT